MSKIPMNKFPYRWEIAYSHFDNLYGLAEYAKLSPEISIREVVREVSPSKILAAKFFEFAKKEKSPPPSKWNIPNNNDHLALHPLMVSLHPANIAYAL
jgi:hypothetical protein